MSQDKVDFKDSQGRWLSRSLFFELNGYVMGPSTIFTNKDEDFEVKGKKLISFKKLFLETDDITGYTMATQHLGGYTHWKWLRESALVGPLIKEVEEQMEVRMRSIGLKSLINSAKNGNYNASKFLSDKGWVELKSGRPSKADIKKEARQMAQAIDGLEADFSRIGSLQ